jgi:hypothetical protein
MKAVILKQNDEGFKIPIAAWIRPLPVFRWLSRSAFSIAHTPPLSVTKTLIAMHLVHDWLGLSGVVRRLRTAI